MAYIRPPNATMAGRGLKQSPNAFPANPAGLIHVVLDADIASASNIGMISVGNGLSVSNTGVLSASTSSSSAILITSDYSATLSDYYIGAILSSPSVITLPLNAPDAFELIIKLEPTSVTDLTIKSSFPNLIDNSPSIILNTALQSISVICRGGNWNII